MDCISSIFVIFFSSYLGSISLIARYRCTGWSVPSVRALYPDSQTVETLRSACISMCRLVMLSFKKSILGQAVSFLTRLQCTCAALSVFSAVTTFLWNSYYLRFTSFCVNILITVLFRVLNIKLSLVKLTFWTAISTHQVMGMSLAKVWVMENIPRWIWSFSCNRLAENQRKLAGHGLITVIRLNFAFKWRPSWTPS